MTYGIIFTGSSSHGHPIVKKCSRYKREQLELLGYVGVGTVVGTLFKNLEILPCKAQYIFSLNFFVVNNMNLFMTNSENHTRQSNNLHIPLAKLKLSINKEFHTQV
jgi:hypothetical protein